MSDRDREQLQAIKTFPSLVKYLRDELDWPIDADDFDDLTFDYEPEELGIDAKTAAKIDGIKQLRPLVTGQPWGIFFVKFEPKRLPVMALRRILSQLVFKKRASARKAEQASWNLHDLLFISNYGEGDRRQITFAHFGQEEGTGDLPTLKVLGWDQADTALHIDHVHQELKEKLHWPDDGEPVGLWRTRWSSAFTLRHREVITTSKALSIRLAHLATDIRKRVNTVLRFESEKGPLRKLHAAFKEALIHDLSADDFADMYAQTITYGLLTAAVSRTVPGEGTALLASDLAAMSPNPFLRDLLSTFLTVGGRKGKIDFDEVGINEVVEVLRSPDTHMDAVLRDFGDRNPQEDPVVHFYELFLKEYDPKKRMQRGVFYTPRPVVSFIVRSVHEILQKEFGLSDGLADTTTWGEMLKNYRDLKLPEIEVVDPKTRKVSKKSIDPATPFVQILDPATGTATFLVEVIDVVYKTMRAKWLKAGHLDLEIPKLWSEYVPDHLLPRLYGFELMMAPYAVAHMKVGLKLYDTGYRLRPHERVRIYLTNSLEEPHDFSDRFEFDAPALAHEAQAVNVVKRHLPPTVVVGNPPYSKSSANQSDWIERLMEAYKTTVRAEETQIQSLSDDYAKFIRAGVHYIGRSGMGVLGYITNNGYLDGPIFRDMRRHLATQFDLLAVVNLHGDSRKKERTPDGTTDDNVFDIQQGVSVSLCARWSGGNAKALRYSDLWGERHAKYTHLLRASVSSEKWEDVVLSESGYRFIPTDSSLTREWDSFVDLYQVFGTGSQESDNHVRYGAGFVTQQDEFAVASTREELRDRIKWFLGPAMTEATAREKFGFCTTNQWNYARARRELQNLDAMRAAVRCLYRPFDWRYTILDRNVCTIVRERIQSQFLRPNVALLTTRRATHLPWNHVFVTNMPAEYKVASHDRNTIVFPLWWLPPSEGALTSFKAEPVPNLNAAFVEFIDCAIASATTIETVFHYLYAVLHSPSYRERYGKLMTLDFARVPIPKKSSLVSSLAASGADLVSMHLLDAEYAHASWNVPKATGRSPLRRSMTKVGGRGAPEIVAGYPKYKSGKVYVNPSCWFDVVPETVWVFHVGGYQVCQKWLKDRRGQVLSQEDIEHYYKIIAAIQETIRLMAEIDKTIDAHGGWPGAFAAGKEVKET